ncbi:MAG: hypothetical protein RLY31_716 [Bacteroidota bacterium]
MLEVVTGMVFTFLLLSLLSTTVNELISSLRGWRGHYMEKGLKRLLAYQDDPAVFERFRDNPLYRQLRQSKVPLRISTAPNYLSGRNFINILTHVLQQKDRLPEQVDDLIGSLPENSELRKVLEQLRSEGYATLDAYKARLNEWFEDVMGQVSGWYRRHLQFVTVLVGLTIAVGLNADSFMIYQHLSGNATARAALSALAAGYAGSRDTVALPGTPGGDSPADQVGRLVRSEEFRDMSNILGLGWRQEHWSDGWQVWLRRFSGWLITAFAISLGAPFWFDVLKKVVSMGSNSGGSQSGSSARK